MNACEKLTTIRLYGVLGSKFGRKYRMVVGSAADAVRALASQLPGFEAFLRDSEKNGHGYAVFYDKRNIGKEELNDPALCEEIRFAPIILGSKNSGVFQIILGVVLIIVGVLITGFSFGWAAPVGGALISLGVGMIVGGIVQLLTPVPKSPGAREKPENQPSYAFNGPVNTQAQGHPVPLLYGEMFTGSAVASAGISAKDQAIIPNNNFGGGGGPVGSGGRGGNGSVDWHWEWYTQVQP